MDEAIVYLLDPASVAELVRWVRSQGDAGLGNFFDDVLSQTRPRIVGQQTNIPSSQVQNNPGVWTQILTGINTGLLIYLNRNNGQTVGVAPGQQNAYGIPPGWTPQQWAEYQARLQNQNYATGAVNQQGLQLGGSTISWPIIMIFIAGIFLLQSRGFSRR